MINHVAVTDGFAADLPSMKGVTFSFAPGLNILFGPNGCGKTSLLKIIAGYTCCQDGGWSKRFDWLNMDKGKEIPAGIRACGCKAKLEWDGTACFYNSTTASDSPISHFGMSDMSFTEEVAQIVNKPSDGQIRLTRLNHQFGQIIGKAPDLTKLKDKTGPWDDPANKYADWVAKLPRTGPSTVLMDEPDRNLSIENQILILGIMLQLATRFQVIITSHSPIMLMRDVGANIIDMSPGYLEHSRKVLKMYTDGTALKEIAKMSELLRMNAQKEDEKKKGK